MLQTDAELVNAVLNGQNQAFAILVKRYERSVRAVCIRILCDRHLTDDAAQNAFVKAYEKLPDLRNPSMFGQWIAKIARRTALDLARNKTKEVSLETDFYSAKSTGNGRLDDEKQRLLEAVVQLPKSEKQVIMLRYFDGLSVKYVADIAGRSVGTVTKQLSRAHKRLRNILSRMEA